MNSPAILKLPDQKVAEWMGKSHAERKLRSGGEIINRKLVGMNKDMEPVYSYLVAYDRPRYIPKL